MEENKLLTKQAITKINNMSLEEKVRLLAKASIKGQNKMIMRQIINAVGSNYCNVVKAEILHELYDGNYQYSYSYKELQDVLNHGEDVYRIFDTYTLCAYALYYNKFIEFAKGANNLNQIRYAAEDAVKFISGTVNQSRLYMGYYEKIKTDSILKKEYRNSLVAYLKQDLKFTDRIKFMEEYMQGKITEKSYKPKASLTKDEFTQFEQNKIYATDVTAYTNNDGSTYYVDAEGNYYEADDITPVKYGNYVIEATPEGIKEREIINYDFDKEIK